MTTETTPQERLEAAELRAMELRKAIIAKVAAGEDFSNEAINLASAVAAHREILKGFNAGALAEETSKLAATLLAMVDASQLSALLGEAISSVYWTRTPGENGSEEIITCGINVKARVAGSTAKPSGSGNKQGGSRKTPRFTVDGGEEMSAVDFVVNYGPPAVQDNILVKPDADGKRKWPTKAEFLKKTEEGLLAAGRTVARVEAG